MKTVGTVMQWSIICNISKKTTIVFKKLFITEIFKTHITKVCHCHLLLSSTTSTILSSLWQFLVTLTFMSTNECTLQRVLYCILSYPGIASKLKIPWRMELSDLRALSKVEDLHRPRNMRTESLQSQPTVKHRIKDYFNCEIHTRYDSRQDSHFASNANIWTEKKLFTFLCGISDTTRPLQTDRQTSTASRSRESENDCWSVEPGISVRKILGKKDDCWRAFSALPLTCLAAEKKENGKKRMKG